MITKRWKWQFRWWCSQIPKRMWEWNEGVWLGSVRMGWGNLSEEFKNWMRESEWGRWEWDEGVWVERWRGRTRQCQM